MFDASEGLEFCKFDKRLDCAEWITFRRRVVKLLWSISPEMLQKRENEPFKTMDWIRKVEEQEGQKCSANDPSAKDKTGQSKHKREKLDLLALFRKEHPALYDDLTQRQLRGFDTTSLSTDNH